MKKAVLVFWMAAVRRSAYGMYVPGTILMLAAILENNYHTISSSFSCERKNNY